VDIDAGVDAGIDVGADVSVDAGLVFALVRRFIWVLYLGLGPRLDSGFGSRFDYIFNCGLI